MNADARPDVVLDKINDAKKTVHGRLALADDVLSLLADAWEDGWAKRASRLYAHLKVDESVPAPSHVNPYRNPNA